MSPDVNDPGYRAVTFDDLVELIQSKYKACRWWIGCALVETILIP